MRCSEARRRLSLAMDDRLSGTERAELEVHVSACEACRSEAALWRGAQGSLRSLGPARVPAGLAQRALAAALSAEGDARAPSETRGMLAWFSELFRFAWPVAGVATAAAALLLALNVAPARSAVDDPAAVVALDASRATDDALVAVAEELRP